MGLLLTTQLVHAQVPSYVPTNGLVGYWPFSGNANDLSGNNNNGTVNGATLTTDRFGSIGSAYSFNGLSNYIRCTNSGVVGSTSRTVSFWVKSNSNAPGSIISYGNNDSTLQDFRIIHNGLGICGQNGDISCAITGSGRGVQYISHNTWDFFTVVYDNSTGTNSLSVKIYKNGVLSSSYCDENPTASINTDSQNPITFGCYHWLNYTGNKQFFSGSLDDIGMWNRALTQQEITSMYNGVTYNNNCNAVSGSMVNGLVAYYPFCGNANDDSGNGHNGVVNGATLTTDRFGNSNSAYGFDGVNDLIKVNHSSSFNTFPMSISLWCKGNSQYGALISKYTSCSSDNGWQLHTMEGKVSTYSYNFLGGAFLNCDGDSNTIISDNNWYNIVSTYDLSGVKIYVNNVLVLTKPYIGNGSMSAPTNIQDLYIGTEINSIGCSPYNTYYQGLIDDIGIWNRVLSQQEITQLFNQNQCITNITVTDTLIINVGQLSYTNPVSFANNITIYPNPASTQVNISFNNITDLAGGSIKIINSLGQQVATTPITATGTNTTMALNSWGGTGLYFVQILNAQGQILDIKKIILQ